MTYNIPSYIPETDNKISYHWDDAVIDETLDDDYAKSIGEKLENISLRAKIALNIGVYEWILAHLGKFSCDLVPFQIAEAAWCANINKLYIYYMDFDHNDYTGPINSPLWCGFSSVIISLYVSNNITDIEHLEKYDYEDQQLFGGNDEYAEIGLVRNIALALYTLPEVQPFKTWLENIVERLIALYSVQEDDKDPYTNLFDDGGEKGWLGDYVPREALNPSFVYNQNDAIPLLEKYLRNVDHKNNPYLVPPKELDGRITQPYYFIPEL